MFLRIHITAKRKNTDKSWIIETFPNFLMEDLAVLIDLSKTAKKTKKKKMLLLETFLAAADKNFHS